MRTVKGFWFFPHGLFFLFSPRLSTWSNLLSRSTITVFYFIFCTPLLTVWCFLWLLVNCCGRFVVTTSTSRTSSDHHRSIRGLCVCAWVESQFKSYSRRDEMLKFRRVAVTCQCKCYLPSFCPFHFILFLFCISTILITRMQ